MNSIESTNQVGQYQAYESNVKEKKNSKENAKEVKSATSIKNAAVVSESKEYGKVIGEPKLSDKATKYYESLKKKFGQYDFVLVSQDEKENAKANASKYANANKTVVLLSDDQIEKMATDEKYRKKYENILSGAASQLEGFKNSVNASGANVQGYGIQIQEDGTAKFFAVLKKSSEAQAERIKEKSEEKRAEKKAEAKKAQKEQFEERIENAKEKNSSEVQGVDDDTITLEANSVEALMRKISDYVFSEKSNSVITPEEAAVGQNFDFAG